MDRSSGILMPVFSLPGSYGIGTFGKSAYEFVDFLADAGVKYWQVLPMHPLTYGNSPYQSTSTFAGNMYLIDLDMLCEDGLLKKSDYDKFDFGDDPHRVDYDKVIAVKKEILRDAAKNFIGGFVQAIEEEEKKIFAIPRFLTRRSILSSSRMNMSEEKLTYNDFRHQFQYYLDDFALFDLIKDRYAGEPFSKWDKIHRLHYDDVIAEIAVQNPYELEVYRVVQYFFFKQWLSLKKYANEKGIQIIGDMPIYSSLDSVEVFVDYKNFLLDEYRRPYEVAGCPPDAFSSEGQLWRNPLYDYDYMRKDGYKYFIKRVAHLHELYDVIRIDHFRGFASYYSIPASENTARNGKWKIGPGKEIFDAIEKEVPHLSIIAEDLGIIDDSVYKLLKDTGYPGMKVVEFAFGGDAEHHQYLPKNYDENCVAYLGTHDNDTFMGWLKSANAVEKEQAIKYLHLNKGTEHRDAMTELFKSKSNLTVVMMQDLLGLGTEARINTPSTVGAHNWSYRFTDGYLDADAKNFLKKLINDTKR